MAVKLKPEPIKWTMGDRWLPESAERDGLRFTVKHDHYGSRATYVVVERASDGHHFESVDVTNQAEAERVVRTWDLESWRGRAEAHALEDVDRALELHRRAMTKLNEIRALRVETPDA